MDRKQIQEELSNEINFLKYIEGLSKCKDDFITIVVASDTPCGSANFTPQVAMKLMSVGFTVPLYNKFRCSYAAISNKGRLVFEGISQTNSIKFDNRVDGTNVLIMSSAYGIIDELRGCKVSIDNKVIYNSNVRGLLFIVFDNETKSVVDLAMFDTYLEDIPRKNKQYLINNFIEKHPEVIFVNPRVPQIISNELTEYEKYIFNNNMDFQKLKTNAGKMKTAIDEYIDEADGIREVLTAPVAYIGTDGARHFKEYAGKYLNIVNGHRLTVGQPKHPKRNIYVIGGCGIFGIGLRDCGTLASQLQLMLNEKKPEKGFIVENYGFYLDGMNTEKEYVKILESLSLKSGDIVIGVGKILTDEIDSKMRFNDKNEWIFDIAGHFTERVYGLLANNVFKTLEKNNFFEENVLEVEDTVRVLTDYEKTNYGLNNEQQGKLQNYKNVLSDFYNNQFKDVKKQPKIGAIVMNCNPFTLGHRYLIEECSKKVDFLVIFVVREDKSFFSFEDRINMVDVGTKDLPNVAVVESGNFIISTLTFLDYFNKSELQDMVIDSSKDVVLFAREIAPALHISIRFAGSEPFDSVTRQYNRTMANILPRYGITFEEIPRLELDDNVVSASHVRELLAKKDWNAIKFLVPETTLTYLKSKY